MLVAQFEDEDYDTIGGLVLNKFGRLPKRGESIMIGDFNFTVIHTDSRRLHMLLVEKTRGEN
jgi:magnesium and cobalt transporter